MNRLKTILHKLNCILKKIISIEDTVKEIVTVSEIPICITQVEEISKTEDVITIDLVVARTGKTQIVGFSSVLANSIGTPSTLATAVGLAGNINFNNLVEISPLGNTLTHSQINQGIKDIIIEAAAIGIELPSADKWGYTYNDSITNNGFIKYHTASINFSDPVTFLNDYKSITHFIKRETQDGSTARRPIIEQTNFTYNLRTENKTQGSLVKMFIDRVEDESKRIFYQNGQIITEPTTDWTEGSCNN